MVPHAPGWVQGCQSHGHCWYQSWATLQAKAGAGRKGCQSKGCRHSGQCTAAGTPSLLQGTPWHPAAEGPGQGCARAGWPLTPVRGTSTAPAEPWERSWGDGHGSAPTALGEGSGRHHPQRTHWQEALRGRFGRGRGVKWASPSHVSELSKINKGFASETSVSLE